VKRQKRIKEALQIATDYGNIDGGHHKSWVIDQMVRALTGCPTVVKKGVDIHGRNYSYEGLGESNKYRQFVAKAKAGCDGPNTYGWDEGIAP
jgi:hypothetical protein